jgi:hypothetical protein
MRKDNPIGQISKPTESQNILVFLYEKLHSGLRIFNYNCAVQNPNAQPHRAAGVLACCSASFSNNTDFNNVERSAPIKVVQKNAFFFHT